MPAYLDSVTKKGVLPAAVRQCRAQEPGIPSERRVRPLFRLEIADRLRTTFRESREPRRKARVALRQGVNNCPEGLRRKQTTAFENAPEWRSKSRRNKLDKLPEGKRPL
jgi:hypothetical protein